MIRRGDDRDEYHRWIPDPRQDIYDFPCPRFPHLPFLQILPEYAGVVQHRAANHKGIAEMHAGHGGEGIDIVSAHPDAGGVIMADRIEEAVFGREQARGHARIKGEG